MPRGSRLPKSLSAYVQEGYPPLFYMLLFPAGRTNGRPYVRHTFCLLFSGSQEYIEEHQSCWGGVYMYMYKVSILDTMVLNKGQCDRTDVSTPPTLTQFFLFATTQLNSTQSWVSLIFLCKNRKPQPYRPSKQKQSNRLLNSSG